MKRKKPTISERQLRKIIREELARQYLVQEGILDSIKKPFQKLSEKAKQIVSQKVDEILEKISAAIDGTKKPKGLDDFIKAFEQAEGGMDMKKLASEVGLEDIVSTLTKSELEEGSTRQESFIFSSVSAEDLTSSFALIEGYHKSRAIKIQRILKEEEELLSEIISLATGLATLANAWWAAIKIAIGFLGGISLACKLFAKIFEKAFNKPETAKRLNGWSHAFHELEEKALRVLAYPAPVAYAAYLAATKVKGLLQTGGEKKLSYEEFNSPEHKEEKEAAEKLIHTVLLSAIIVEAISHIGHAVKELAENTSHALKSIGHSTVEIGKEASAISKTAKVAAGAGT